MAKFQINVINRIIYLYNNLNLSERRPPAFTSFTFLAFPPTFTSSALTCLPPSKATTNAGILSAFQNPSDPGLIQKKTRRDSNRRPRQTKETNHKGPPQQSRGMILKVNFFGWFAVSELSVSRTLALINLWGQNFKTIPTMQK